MKIKLPVYVIFIFISFFSLKESNAFMFWNQACSFSGAQTSYIAFKDSNSIDITSSFTLECWICPLNVSSPSAQIIMEKRAGTSANGYTLYLNNGFIAVRTNSSTRIIGNTVIPNNSWTHIAGTYDASSNVFSVFINGTLDTSAIVTSASPVTNSDSLRIGKGNINSPYAGLMDEIRIWSGALSLSEVNRCRRTSLGVNSGIYSSLAFSLTFQQKESMGSDFTLADMTMNNGSGKNNGISAYDQSDRPSVTVSPNECIELNGSSDFLTGSDNPDISPVNAVTMEAWIYPRNVTGIKVIIQKGQSGINYNLRLAGNSLNAYINDNFNFISTGSILPDVWTHVAFTYNAASGKYAFYINGVKSGEGSNLLGPVINSSENLFIGSNGTSLNFFNGFLDEIRISNYVKSETDIQRFLYQSVDQANEPNPGRVNVVYNLDGYAFDNSDNGPVLTFVNGAKFSDPGTTDNQPVSPLDRSDANNFSDGFYMRTANKHVPGAGGLTLDSMKINLDTIVSDINIFVSINHTREEDLNITLESPSGDVCVLSSFNTLVANSDNLITVFDDQADSMINTNGRYVSYSPSIRAYQNQNSKFAGKDTKGYWKIRIYDGSTAENGQLYAWGIQFNEASVKIPGMALRVFNQGFYRQSDTCAADTIKIHLRENIAPFNDVGIKDETPDEDNFLHINFPAADFVQNYYIETEHRNSLETWSSQTVAFDFLSGNLNYDFTLSREAAFGSNQINVDSTLLRYAIYSGDINQDDNISLSDVLLAYNDASVFSSGYVVSDVTGDNIVDLTDLIITDNNSNNFISKITP